MAGSQPPSPNRSVRAHGARRDRGSSLPSQTGRDHSGDVVLNGENVVEFAVVVLAPDMDRRGRVDQLHSHLTRLPVFRTLPSTMYLTPSFSATPVTFIGLAAELEGEVPRNDQKAPELAKPGDDVFGYP